MKNEPIRIQIHSAGACAIVLTVLWMLLTAPSTSFAATFLFTNGSAWLTAANWKPNGPPGQLDIAEFDINVPTTGSGGVQINFNKAVNNGPTNEAVGAIWVLPTRTSAELYVGNGSGATNGFLTLNGATLNGTNNVILENDSTNGSDITITNVGNGGANVTMGLVLANTASNLVVMNGNGTIGISDIISSSNNVATPLAFTGFGSGTATVSGTANTFSGGITLSGPEVDFSGNGSLGNSGNSITVDGGRLGLASSADISSHAIFLGATAGTSISAVGSGTIITYTGVLADKPGATGILVKQGKGMLSLGGVNTYSGGTSNNNGAIQLTTGNNRLPATTTLNMGQPGSANLGALDLNGFNQQIAGLDSVPGNNTNSAAKNTVTNSSATAATLTLSGSGTYAYGDGTTNNSGVITGLINLVMAGAGSQTLGDINTYTGTTTISNGTLVVNGSLAVGSVVAVAANGTLAGTGTVGGAVTVNGTLAPGSPSTIGTLTCLSTVTFNGTNVMKLDKASQTNDVLSVAGNLAYGGTLNLTNLSGTLTSTDKFILFEATSYGGAFAQILPATPGPDLQWNTNTLVSNGTLSIVSAGPGTFTNPTSITSFSLAANGNVMLTGTNGQSGDAYYLLASTNVTLPFGNWVTVATNVLGNSGNFMFIGTNVVIPGAPQQFYILSNTNN
jgi:autotransporter-associated beta strand protein